MTKVIKIPTSKIIQFESKQTPTIQQEKNIIKKDNIGTVVPGDALRNINLSTIPDIIQDAINKAILDAKTQTLADSLISTMRQTIENFEDGIYTKSYIDTTISYLEELLTQKVSPEIVASIAEAKIAVATSELATTSQVGIISSRLENSESEIINIKETINTKDTARATQIEELQASINQSLSNYSDAIELTIDSEGNVKSQKIESLLSQNARAIISIDENNKITLDENGNFTAYVSKFISDNNGNIVGFSFTDSDDAQSAFGINADVFKIADSENRYTPFRIENGNIYFNGKVTFSSISSTETDWQQQVQNAINNNATIIDGGKIVTNQALVNSLNAVGGIIAETISANEIVGKTITGGVINGARINGAVIKASYLDLNGDLEVLTNYIITVAMYNANPSLYTDAVYISADNQYRIPTLSAVRENTISVHITGTGTWYGTLKSYNTANAGHNLKAVKIRPSFYNNQSFNLITSTAYVYREGTVSNHFSLSLGGFNLLTYHVKFINGSEVRVTISGAYLPTITKTIENPGYGEGDGYTHVNNNLNLGFGVCNLSVTERRGELYNEGYFSLIALTVRIDLHAGDYLLPFNWTSGGIQFTQHVKPNTLEYSGLGSLSHQGYTTFNLNQSLSINNMI